MKKIIYLLATILIFSCSKENTVKDLTQDIVGIYTGTLYVDSYIVPGQQIKITKIDESAVLIQSYNSTMSSTFRAKLTEGGAGIILSIPEQLIAGGTIRGDINAYPDDPDANGAYVYKNKQFVYAIKVIIDNIELSESFDGLKQ